MKALVTGASGFVGKHLVEHLLSCGDEVALADRVECESSSSKAQSFSADILDLEDCRKTVFESEPDVIYHLAGIAFMPQAEKDFNQVLRINVGGVYNMLSAANDYQLKTGKVLKFILVSSGQVYGKSKDIPVTENTAVVPANNYSLSKTLAEDVVLRFSDNKNLKVVIARPLNHIGPGQNSRFVVSNFAKQLIDIKNNKSEPRMMVGNLTAERDFTDVRDIVRAYRIIAEKAQSGVFNLCSGAPVSIQSILDLLVEQADVEVNIEQDPDRMRPSEVPVMYGSYEKALSELGWRPEITLRESLLDVLNWVKQNG